MGGRRTEMNCSGSVWVEGVELNLRPGHDEIAQLVGTIPSRINAEARWRGRSALIDEAIELRTRAHLNDQEYSAFRLVRYLRRFLHRCPAEVFFFQNLSAVCDRGVFTSFLYVDVCYPSCSTTPPPLQDFLAQSGGHLATREPTLILGKEMIDGRVSWPVAASGEAITRKSSEIAFLVQLLDVLFYYVMVEY